MDELDEIKELWKSNGPAVSIEQQKTSPQIADAIARYQKKVRRTNIVTSILIAFTITFLISLIFIYNDESWLFTASLIAVCMLSGGAAIVLWTRSMDSSKQMTLSAADYTAYQLKKLKRSKRIIEYSPLYGLILGILINVYAYSLIHHASGEFVFWITNINWLYIVLVSYISYKVKMKRYNRDVQPIVDELESF